MPEYTHLYLYRDARVELFDTTGDVCSSFVHPSASSLMRLQDGHMERILYYGVVFNRISKPSWEEFVIQIALGVLPKPQRSVCDLWCVYERQRPKV